MPGISDFNGKWWLATGLVVAGITAGGGYYLIKGLSPTVSAREEASSAGVRVEVVRPQKGGMDRTTLQPGSVQAFESANLYAEVPGYLSKQTVDIGDRVKKGQVLAEIDVPELEKQVKRHEAALERARANVQVMKARVASATADWEVAKSLVLKAEATEKSAKAYRVFRDKQFRRMQALFATKSIDERLVDEKQDQAEAAAEAERAARAAIASANAQVSAALAKIQQANADVADADAGVKVAQAELEKAQVMVQFATVTSPYDGVITKRNFFPGDFVKAATEGGQNVPLLTVERTDKMRVVVQVPDRDVPYCDPGDPAFVEIDALPGKKFAAQVSRIASSEDPQTRLMRVEIDLPNPTGKICQGMYGRVTIVLEKSPNLLSVPSSCVVGKTEDGKGEVYVIRDGRAHLTPVQIGTDDGLRTAILAGLKEDDEVVLHPGSALGDGAPVVASPVAGEAH
jgi:RND family efflux transporter MFP subunit